MQDAAVAVILGFLRRVDPNPCLERRYRPVFRGDSNCNSI